MAKEIKTLNVRELLKSTYSVLTEKNRPSEIILPKETLTEIGNDSDWHRTKKGYMGYEKAGLFKFNGKIWVIARGEKCGDYPAARYDSDLIALDMPGEEKRRLSPDTSKLKEMISEGSYFANSLVLGMDDGNVAFNGKGRFGDKLMDILKSKIEGFIAQKPEYDESVLSTSTLAPVNTKPMLYKPEFANFLADSIETVLKS
jgi:hypothetical protein